MDPVLVPSPSRYPSPRVNTGRPGLTKDPKSYGGTVPVPTLGKTLHGHGDTGTHSPSGSRTVSVSVDQDRGVRWEVFVLFERLVGVVSHPSETRGGCADWTDRGGLGRIFRVVSEIGGLQTGRVKSGPGYPVGLTCFCLSLIPDTATSPWVRPPFPTGVRVLDHPLLAETQTSVSQTNTVSPRRLSAFRDSSPSEPGRDRY